MRKRVSVVVLGALVGLALVGCHADEDDPAGQAEELHDPVRRGNAISNLTSIYTTALSCCEKKKDEDGQEVCVACERSDPQVKKIADEIVDDLVKVYIENPEDTHNGQKIIDLLKEMQDPRSIDALVAALDWRTEVTEEHAVRAAQTLQRMEIPKGKVATVIDALSKALEKIDGSRPVDNRMRIEFLRALGSIGDPRATDVLAEIATKQSEDQDFLINRLAAQQLGTLADERAVPAMIKGLFLFSPSNPAMRMNDVAAEVLVRIGKPSYDPLIKVLKGEHEKANAIAKAYIEAIEQRKPQAAANMSVEQVTSSEATFALGALGFAKAFDPLMKEMESDSMPRRINAAIALVRLNTAPNKRAEIRKALQSVYEEAGVQVKPQLMAAMRHMYDPKILPFFLEQAKDGELHPVVRLEAIKAYALLANADEAKTLREFINSDAAEESGYQEKWKQLLPALDDAKQCDENLACWQKKLDGGIETEMDKKEQEEAAEKKEGEKETSEGKQAKLDKRTLRLRKAAYMLGRLGRGNQGAIDSLTDKLGYPNIQVRLAALQALDRIAVDGAPKAVDKINELQKKEEGQALWTQFRKEALPVQARLRTRAGG